MSSIQEVVDDKCYNWSDRPLKGSHPVDTLVDRRHSLFVSQMSTFGQKQRVNLMGYLLCLCRHLQRRGM